MKTSGILTAVCMMGAASSTSLATPPNYTVTNITNWNAQQLGTLPFFKHYRPAAIPVPNAPTDFHVVSRTSSGLIAGNTWNVFTGPDQRGVLLASTGVHTIDSYGDFHWWRTSPPATATYRLTNALDVNWAGTVVGWANLPGTSQTSQQGPDVHAITYDTIHDKTDILTDARYGYANCINNRGEIAGYASGGPGSVVGGFRRTPDGQFTLLNPIPPGYHVQPLWINAQGVAIGMSVPGGWVSPEGSTVVPLPKLFGMPLATVTDINDAGWIVGTSESWDHTERYATLWEPNGDGTWTARDLTDLILTSGILLLRAWSINNDGNIVVAGQLDNGDNGPFGTYLLTPTSTRSSTCMPDIGLHPQPVTACGTSVSFGVQVVNADATTTYQWSRDGEPIAASSNPSAVTPALALPAMTNADAGTYECIVTNTCGSTTSNPATLTVDGPTCCIVDIDDGTGTGTPDGGVTIDDLLYYLFIFESGDLRSDVDDGSSTGALDGGVTIDDLLYYLQRFEAGC